MKTLKEVLFDCKNVLSKNNVCDADALAEFIVSEVCRIKRNEIFLNYDRPLNLKEIRKINKYSKEAIFGKPISWILKTHNFNGIDIYIKDGVFVPRPETEELAEMVLKRSYDYKNPYILDFCAGSGAIGIYVALKNKNAKVFAIDKSKRAFDVMIKNREILKIDNFLPFRSSKIDIFDFKFDIVVSNPPYVPLFMYERLPVNVKKEPKSAIIGGYDGLDFIRYILSKINIIKDGGILFLEIGEYYSDKIIKLLSKYFKKFDILKDMNKKDRFIFAVKE